MSKEAKKRQGEKRRMAKRASKLANYTRCGPKKSNTSIKKRAKKFGEGSITPPPPKGQKTSPKGRKRRRRNGANLRVGK